MRAITLKGNDTAILHEYLDLLEETEKRINLAESRIRAVCRQDELCRLLDSIPGIGTYLQ